MAAEHSQFLFHILRFRKVVLSYNGFAIPIFIIHIVSIIRDKDFWAEGRTVEKLGIKNMSIKEIRLLAVAGEI